MTDLQLAASIVLAVFVVVLLIVIPGAVTGEWWAALWIFVGSIALTAVLVLLIAVATGDIA